MLTILNKSWKFFQLVFSSEKFAFFFKNLCFQQFRKCYRYDLITSTVIVKIPFGPLQIVPWGLSHSKIRENKAKIFCHREASLLLKSLVLEYFRSSRNDHIVFAQYLSNDLLNPYKVVSWLLFFSILREEKATIFFSMEFLPFSRNFCVQQPLKS